MRNASGQVQFVLDLRLARSKAYITAICSKNDQCQKGTVTMLDPCSDQDLWPVFALSHYLAVWGKDYGLLLDLQSVFHGQNINSGE